MPIVKRTTSGLGNEIVSSIQSFIKTNADAMANDEDRLDLDKASEAMAHAIAYGIAKAFGSTVVQTAFQTGGICPPSGGPVGTTIVSALRPGSTEVA